MTPANPRHLGAGFDLEPERAAQAVERLDAAFDGNYPQFIINPSAQRNSLHSSFTNGRSPSWEFVGGVKMGDTPTTPVIYTRGLQTNGLWSATSGVYKDKIGRAHV